MGRHLPTSGGLRKTLALAEEQGCEALQVFVSNPQGWAEPMVRDDAEAFVEGARKIGISPGVAHAKYLINLASPREDLRENSMRALAAELVAAGELGLDLVVVHAGSHGGDGEEKGVDRLVEGLERVRELAGNSGRAAEAVEGQQGLHERRQLGERQVVAEAFVHAPPEVEVVVPGALQVERERVGELDLIHHRGTVGGEDQLPRRDHRLARRAPCQGLLSQALTDEQRRWGMEAQRL